MKQQKLLMFQFINLLLCTRNFLYFVVIYLVLYFKIAAASVAFGIGALGLAWYIQDLYSRLDDNDDVITSRTTSLSTLEDDLDTYKTKEAEICSAVS